MSVGASRIVTRTSGWGTCPYLSLTYASLGYLPTEAFIPDVTLGRNHRLIGLCIIVGVSAHAHATAWRTRPAAALRASAQRDFCAASRSHLKV
eukprot:1306756-Pleurochrysis_carterae.AAC.1